MCGTCPIKLHLGLESPWCQHARVDWYISTGRSKLPDVQINLCEDRYPIYIGTRSKLHLPVC